MIKKVFSWFSLCLLLVSFLSACSPSTAAQRPPIRVEYTVWYGDYTLLIAQEKGFFEKHGVRVEPVFYSDFTPAVKDMASNRFDAGLFGMGDLLNASRLVNVKAVAVYDQGGTSAVVARPEINTTADLKGKKVGAVSGTSGELIVREMLNSAGMTVKDITLVEVSPESVVDKLTSGEIDAGYVWAPYDARAVEQGNKIVYSSTASGAASLQPDVIVFREAVIRERPEDVRAFLTAWFEALEFRMANPDESNAIISRITKQPVEDLKASSDLKLNSQQENLRMFEKDITDSTSIYYAANVNLNFLISRGLVTQAPEIKKILDPSFLK